MHEKKQYQEQIIDTPIIYLKFKRDKIILSFEEVGYYNLQNYEEIGLKISNILNKDFEKIESNNNKFTNYTDLIFLEKRKPLIIGENREFVKGKIELDSRLKWEYKKQPHLLLVAPTGAGKSYFIFNYLIPEFEEQKSYIFILDPKNETSLEYREKYYFATSKGQILALMRQINIEMDKRHEKKKNNYRPIFVIIEEIASLKISLEPKEVKEFEKYFTNLLLKGRSAGINLVVISQSADSELFKTSSMRDNFHVRISLGYISKEKSLMVFGVSKKDLPIKSNLIGSGYIMLNDRVYTYTTPRDSGEGMPKNAGSSF